MLRAVVLTESVGLGLALAVLFVPDEARLGTLDGVAGADAVASPLLDAEADAEPDCARGPASAAVFTLPFDDVVIPVELFTWLDGDVAVPLALAEAGAEFRVAEADAPRPVTGTQGVVMGVAAGEVALGWVVPELPDVPGFCAANAPTDRTAAMAALLVIIASRFFTEPFLS